MFRLVAILSLLFTSALPGAEPPLQTALGPINAEMPVEFDSGVSLQLANGVLGREAGSREVVIAGRDLEGKPWTIRMATVRSPGVSMAFSAHLDRDSVPDLFVIHSNTGNGMCAIALGLSVILFDDRGRPTPWYARALFNADAWGDEGLQDWADWDGDGGVELIFPECYNYDYNTADSKYPGGGFGLRAVYEASGGYWRKLRKEERAPFESAYRQTLVRGGRRLVPRPADPFLPLPPDLSNDPSQGRKIRSFRVVRGEKSPPRDGEHESLELRRKLEHHIEIGAEEFCYGAPLVVVDREEGREVLFDGGSDHAWNVLREISGGKFDVVLTGQSEEGICSPTVVWAFQR